MAVVVAALVSGCGGGGGSGGGGNTVGSSGGTSANDNNTATAAAFHGTITLDDYDWFKLEPFLGVTELTLSPLTKARVFTGSRPRRHASGVTVYRQGCGDDVYRIVKAETGGLPVAVTPCSSDIENPGFNDTFFDFSALSPDGRLVAVETAYYRNSRNNYWTLVFDVDTLQEVTRFEGYYEPAWFSDGRLLLGGESGGLFETDAGLATLEPFAGGLLTGDVRNAAPSPDDSRIAFEMDQQIWLVNSDGTDAHVVVTGARRFRYPAWSPDGSAIAYLGVSASDYYDPAVYITDLASSEHYALDATGIIDSTSQTFNGPLTWW